jgi:hypothetical protein
VASGSRPLVLPRFYACLCRPSLLKMRYPPRAADEKTLQSSCASVGRVPLPAHTLGVLVSLNNFKRTMHAQERLGRPCLVRSFIGRASQAYSIRFFVPSPHTTGKLMHRHTAPQQHYFPSAEHHSICAHGCTRRVAILRHVESSQASSDYARPLSDASSPQHCVRCELRPLVNLDGL